MASPQDFVRKLNMKPFLLLLSFILALAWEDNTIIGLSQALAKGGGNLWNLKRKKIFSFFFRIAFYFKPAEK